MIDTRTKLIFLDIDGVLNCHTTKERTPKYRVGGGGWASLAVMRSYVGIEAQKVVLLKRIIDATNARVVLSSTWRLHPEMYPYMWERLGEDIKSVYVGSTKPPPAHAFVPRGKEIHDWLVANCTEDYLKPATHSDRGLNFIILDDEDYVSEYFGHEFIHIDPAHGLTDKHVEISIKKLSP